MKQFAIETGVPLPLQPVGRKKQDYPFFDMKVGDSFFVPLEKNDLRHGAMRVRVAANRFAHLDPGVRFSVHIDADQTGARCWRTA